MKLTSIQPHLIRYLEHLSPANDTAQMMRVFDALLKLAGNKLTEARPAKSETENAMELLRQYRMMARWSMASSKIAQEVAESIPVDNYVSRKLETYSDTQNNKENTIRNLGIPEMVHQVAKKFDLPGNWFERLIQIESGFNPNAKSSRGAMGLGQLMPDTAREWGLRVASDRKEGSVWHPRSNLEVSARYLKWLHSLYQDLGLEGTEAWKFTAAAYNAGVGNIGKAIQMLPPEVELVWSEVEEILPRVTGTHAAETSTYIHRLYAT